jgi:molecular chaperone DnaK (HSP70)
MIYLGIDLGTSNTAVSWFNASRGKSLEFKLDQMGIGGVKTKEKTIPSAILVQEKETFLFGKYASQQAMENQPDNVAKSWKLFLGSGMKMKVRGREYDPEYFPKILLEFIRREVEKYFRNPSNQPSLHSLRRPVLQ